MIGLEMVSTTSCHSWRQDNDASRTSNGVSWMVEIQGALKQEGSKQEAAVTKGHGVVSLNISFAHVLLE
jgi:hypothetical protein